MVAIISYAVIASMLFSSISNTIGGGDPLYAHNDIKTSIPVASQIVTLDGTRSEEEWEDASKFNFSTPTREGNVSIYLQYDLTENSMLGAFFIPDKTRIEDTEQIAFLFDVNHSALNTISSVIQDMVLIRNGTSEYYNGVDLQDDNSPYKLVESATLNSNDSSRVHPPMSLKSPFSKTDFAILSGNESWQGEFKIFFKDSPKTMGFSRVQHSGNWIWREAQSRR